LPGEENVTCGVCETPVRGCVNITRMARATMRGSTLNILITPLFGRRFVARWAVLRSLGFG